MTPEPDPLLTYLLRLGLIEDEDLPVVRELLMRARRVAHSEDDLLSFAQALGRAVERVAGAGADNVVRAVADLPEDERAAAVDELVDVLTRQTIDSFNVIFTPRLRRLVHRRLATGNAADPHAQLTVAFVDLRGTTGFMLDSPAAAIKALADELYLAGQEVAARHDVSAGKYLGDGILLLSSDRDRLVHAATDAVSALGLRTPLRAGAGVARGEVIRRAGDWLGTPVNLAARLAELAGPDEILLDTDVADPGIDCERWVDVTPRGLGQHRRVAVLRAPDA